MSEQARAPSPHLCQKFLDHWSQLPPPRISTKIRLHHVRSAEQATLVRSETVSERRLVLIRHVVIQGTSRCIGARLIGCEAVLHVEVMPLKRLHLRERAKERESLGSFTVIPSLRRPRVECSRGQITLHVSSTKLIMGDTVAGGTECLRLSARHARLHRIAVEENPDRIAQRRIALSVEKVAAHVVDAPTVLNTNEPAADLLLEGLSLFIG